MKRKLKLETRYAHLLRDAKVLTVMLELAAQRLADCARGFGPDDVIARTVDGKQITASEVRELQSECTRIAHESGRQNRRSR